MTAPAPGVSDLAVETAAHGELIVTWAVAAAPVLPDGAGAGYEATTDGRLELSVGPSPDPAGHHPVAVADLSAGRVVLDFGEGPQLEPGARPFVSASVGDGPPAVAADRHIPLDGPVNFRDLGGYRTVDGRRVRWGRVFRADTLVLSDADVARFRHLGIRTVYDLRNEIERSATPDRLPEPDPPAVHLLPLISEDPEQSPMAAIGRAGAKDFLRLLYLHILERSAPTIGRILAGLAEDAALPAVYHCSAGKDRTGLVSGVLLSVLGVPMDIIVDDYEMTGRYQTTEHVQATVARIGERQKLAPEVVAGMLEAPRPAMELALGETARRHGGFDRYLTGAAGAPADLPDRLRGALLEP